MAYFRLCMSLIVAAGTAVGLLGVALEMIRARGTYQVPLDAFGPRPFFHSCHCDESTYIEMSRTVDMNQHDIKSRPQWSLEHSLIKRKRYFDDEVCKHSLKSYPPCLCTSRSYQRRRFLSSYCDFLSDGLCAQLWEWVNMLFGKTYLRIFCWLRHLWRRALLKTPATWSMRSSWLPRFFMLYMNRLKCFELQRTM